MSRRHICCLAVAGILGAHGAIAAVSAEEAKKLGTTLTEWGAEKAGNKEGTIPAYDAATAQPKAPANWDPKNPRQRHDPFGEKPLFTITAQNYQQYADKLDGMVELFKQYPNYKMNVYPTHRTASYPKYVIENTLKNATSCKSTNGDLILEGCYGGVPFPIPTNGSQVMWNHLLTYENAYMSNRTNSWLVNPTGAPIMVGQVPGISSVPYYDPKDTGPRASNSIYWRYRTTGDEAPARIVGNQLVLLDPLDGVNVGRRAYQYIPGQRRVKLAPDLAYDTPSPFSGGSQNMDDAKGFLGAIDHFDWTLKGKKEKFILYNNFAMDDMSTCPADKLTTPKFPNPECMRWELHRVWVVEGKVKAGFRHVYKKRIHYWDEDTYGAGMSDNYDAADKLYRINVVTSWPFYKGETYGTISGLNYVMDLRTGIYSMQGIGPCPTCGWQPTEAWSAFKFSPEAMAGEGIR